MPTNVLLDDEELELMCQLLAQHLRELRLEIAHSDHREFREALKSRYERFEALWKTLEERRTAAGGISAADAP
jgi:hypothetical protein